MSVSDYDLALDHYEWLSEIIHSLANANFLYIPPHQVPIEKARIVSRLKQDAAFEMLSKFEANIHEDFRLSLYTRANDEITTVYRDAFRQYWKRTKNKGKNTAIRDFPIEDILILLRDVLSKSGFKAQSETCSLLKGYFRLFRNWYAHGQLGDAPQVPDPDQLHGLCSSVSNVVIGR